MSKWLALVITLCLTPIIWAQEPSLKIENSQIKQTPIVLIEKGWVREVPPNLTLTAAYMQMTNLTDQKLVLLGGSSSDFKTVEIHKTIFENDIARMIPVEQVPILVHEQVSFKPKGLHVMLIGRQRPLKVGDTVTLNLRFDQGLTQTISLKVKKGKSEMKHHHH